MIVGVRGEKEASWRPCKKSPPKAPSHSYNQSNSEQSETCQKGVREGKAINIARAMAMLQVRKEANTFEAVTRNSLPNSEPPHTNPRG